MKKFLKPNFNYVLFAFSLTTTLTLLIALNSYMPLAFFTIQANIILNLWFWALLIDNLFFKSKLLNPQVRYYFSLAASFYIAVVLIAYWSFVSIIPSYVAMYDFKHIWVHVITPIFTVFYFFYFIKPIKPNKKVLISILVYPILYLIIAVTVAFNSERFVYPFLNSDAMGGVLYVVIAILSVVAVFLTLFKFYIKLQARDFKKKKIEVNK